MNSIRNENDMETLEMCIHIISAIEALHVLFIWQQYDAYDIIDEKEYSFWV